MRSPMPSYPAVTSASMYSSAGTPTNEFGDRAILFMYVSPPEAVREESLTRWPKAGPAAEACRQATSRPGATYRPGSRDRRNTLFLVLTVVTHIHPRRQLEATF